jgi:hypothetical protein
MTHITKTFHTSNHLCFKYFFHSYSWRIHHMIWIDSWYSYRDLCQSSMISSVNYGATNKVQDRLDPAHCLLQILPIGASRLFRAAAPARSVRDLIIIKSTSIISRYWNSYNLILSFSVNGRLREESWTFVFVKSISIKAKRYYLVV